MGTQGLLSPLDSRIAELLGADHPYFSERAALNQLLLRYFAEYRAVGVVHWPYPTGLDQFPAGKEVRAQSPRQGEALVLMVLQAFDPWSVGTFEVGLSLNNQAYRALCEYHLAPNPDLSEAFLLALLTLVIAAPNRRTHHPVTQALIVKSVMRGVSPALREDARRLLMAMRADDGCIWVLTGVSVFGALTHIATEAPAPEEMLPIAPRVEADIEAYFQEALQDALTGGTFIKARQLNPRALEGGRRILLLPAAEQAVYVLPTLKRLLVSVWCQDAVMNWMILTALLRALLRNAAPPDAGAWVASFYYLACLADLEQSPNASTVTALEAWHKENDMPEDMRHALRRWRDTVKDQWTTQRQRALVERMSRLIDDVRDEPAVEKGPWGRQAKAWLRSLPEAEQEAWRMLLAQAKTAGETAKPSAKWLKAMTAVVDQVGQEPYREQVVAWLEDFPLTPAKPERNTNLMKGLIWGLGTGGGGEIAYQLGHFARRAFAKVPGYGPGSLKLGNAAVLALGGLGGNEGIAQLTGLKARVRYPSARSTVDQVLEALAGREGISTEEIEELGVPSLGLGSDGRRLIPLGDYQAELAITGGESAELRWITPAGKRQKSVPVAVKRDHGEAVKDLKRDLKALRDALGIQRMRLESLMTVERSWDYGTWRARYGEHPLLGALCRRLIWRFEADGAAQSALPREDGFFTAEGDAVEPDDQAARVALWHPIDSTVEEVRAWRDRLSALEITQPFKQAHREIYILTEAERQTGTYSNRFASHVIRQHQFRALCQQRDWQYELQGSWDSHNTPTRAVPDLGLEARFVVDAPDYDREHPERWNQEGATGFAFLTTDRVQFLDAAFEPITLETVPRRLFSELMRDVDLFVSLTSVGNNPEWHDGGPNGRFAAYWHSYAFGELGAFAETRREVLAELLPKLKIAGQLELGERFLTVRGRLRTYKIHLRSANILMEPNDQYLCIVVGRSVPKPGQALCLPFEGDPVISLILSKAILLAADDKIMDPVIVSQIQS